MSETRHDDHRHPKSWRVDPGPSGRGKPDPDSTPPPLRPHLSGRLLLFLVFVLVMNI
jgi:hypothetical protein